MSLRGKNVVITGATGGIGQALAIRCAREGANLILHYSGRSPTSVRRAEGLLQRIRDLTGLRRPPLKVAILPGDLTKRTVVVELARKVRVEFEEIHGLAMVHGHYVPGLWKKRSRDYSESEELLIWKTDVRGSKYCITEFAPAMVETAKSQRMANGLPATGSIVLISSTPALGSIPQDAHGRSTSEAYSIAKSAIFSLMRHAVVDYRPFVRVNTVAPGNVSTGWAHELTNVEKRAAALETPLQRWIKPEEVASVISFLLSTKASAVNNQVIAVDGGLITGR